MIDPKLLIEIINAWTFVAVRSFPKTVKEDPRKKSLQYRDGYAQCIMDLENLKKPTLEEIALYLHCRFYENFKNHGEFHDGYYAALKNILHFMRGYIVMKEDDNGITTEFRGESFTNTYQSFLYNKRFKMNLSEINKKLDDVRKGLTSDQLQAIAEYKSKIINGIMYGYWILMDGSMGYYDRNNDYKWIIMEVE